MSIGWPAFVVTALASPVQLRTPSAVRAYVKGTWRVRKRLAYERPDGWSGSASGEVVVAAQPSQPTVLMWRESCKLYLDARPDEPLAAHKHLAIRCGAEWPASVYFVDGAPELATDNGWGARAEQRLFVELVPRGRRVWAPWPPLRV